MSDVYVKDGFRREEEAFVSVKERGFRFGDGVFETIAVVGGVPYQWGWHMERLSGGLAAIRIAYDISQLAPLSRELLRRNRMQDGLLRISISRGIGGRGYDPGSDCTPTLVIETMEQPTPPARAVTLWLASLAKIPLTSLPVGYKLSQGMHSTLCRMEAREHGCDEALLLDGNGRLCETTASNLFWLEGGTLCTPLLATGALSGSTRAVIKRLSPWPVRELVAPPAALARAEAVMIANAAQGVVPVCLLEPYGWQWTSEEAAAQLATLLQAERKSEAARLRAQWS